MRVPCEACAESGECMNCEGDGCEDCDYSGLCPECDGQGESETDDEEGD